VVEIDVAVDDVVVTLGRVSPPVVVIGVPPPVSVAVVPVVEDCTAAAGSCGLSAGLLLHPALSATRAAKGRSFLIVITTSCVLRAIVAPGWRDT
jgi:hypothetical protein